MERLRSHLFLLQLLERELARQWSYLQNGQVDLAVSVFRKTSRTRRYLERLPPIPGTDPAIRAILERCINLNDKIESELESGAAELSRAIFRMAADRRIRELFEK